MRSIFYLPVEVATAFFFSASIGIGSGVAVISFTHRVGDGLKVALVAFLVAAVAFGWGIWRSYRPQPQLRSQRPVRRMRAAPSVVSQRLG